MPPEQEIAIRIITLFVALSGIIVIFHGIVRRTTEIQRVLLALIWLIPLSIFQFDRIMEEWFGVPFLIPSGGTVHYVSAFLRLGAVLIVTIYGTIFLIEKFIREREGKT